MHACVQAAYVYRIKEIHAFGASQLGHTVEYVWAAKVFEHAINLAGQAGRQAMQEKAGSGPISSHLSSFLSLFTLHLDVLLLHFVTFYITSWQWIDLNFRKNLLCCCCCCVNAGQMKQAGKMKNMEERE